MVSVPSNRLSAREWLQQQVLGADRHLYVVMSNASEANPLLAYYQQQEPITPLPIWDGTPYADWREVMPYLGELTADSALFEWIDLDKLEDWGWLATSPYPADTVLPHLKALTQVRMPSGSDVFFRFWDGRHLLPILTHLGSKAGELLPVFDQYLINGQSHSLLLPSLPAAQDYPWWQVPAELVKQLNQGNPATLVENLMQWLREDHAELYFALPEHNLKLKAERFVRNGQYTEVNLAGQFMAHLEQELKR